MNLIETGRNIFAIPDLRKRLFYTFALLAVYRLGSHIPTPGVDPVALSEFFKAMRHRRGLPVRGQRTRTNARTRKGPKKGAAALKK